MSGRAGLVLDAGAFIAVERGDPVVSRMLDYAQRYGTPMVTSAGVIAQVWRGGKDKQAPLAYLIKRTKVVDLDGMTARLLGLLLGASGTADPIDAHVVVLARSSGWPILTSDPADLRRIDHTVEVELV
jgi:hypothetical protein